MNKLYSQWIEALETVGLKPISDDTCCKLLAVVYVFGGNSESFTSHLKLVADIQYSQKRMNINGGLIPNADLLPILQTYIKELEVPLDMASYKEKSSFKKCSDSWAFDFMKDRYGIELV